MLTYNARIVLDTLLPQSADEGAPMGIFDVGFDEWYEQWLHEAPPQMILGFHAGLFAATWLAPLLIKRPPPLSLYDRRTREEALQALYDSDINAVRQLPLILKVTTGFCYGGDPQVRQQIGYPAQFDERGQLPENVVPIRPEEAA